MENLGVDMIRSQRKTNQMLVLAIALNWAISVELSNVMNRKTFVGIIIGEINLSSE
jgi:hypothetical protein